MATVTSFRGGTAVRFTRRFLGVLALDSATFEDVEADTRAGAQAALVVVLACVAAGFAAVGSTTVTLPSFLMGAVSALFAWAVWALAITTIGIHLLPEPETNSRPGELLRTMGFAAAPGVFYAFGVIPSAAPVAFAVASSWMIAATVLGVRQALDYRSLGRAALVCVAAWLLTFGAIVAAGLLLGRPVS